jgi:hypothetical protein
MFQRAIKEDFEAKKTGMQPSSTVINTVHANTLTSKHRITKKKTKKDANINIGKPQAVFKAMMSAGGFFSSRGSATQMEVQGYPGSKDVVR